MKHLFRPRNHEKQTSRCTFFPAKFEGFVKASFHDKIWLLTGLVIRKYVICNTEPLELVTFYQTNKKCQIQTFSTWRRMFFVQFDVFFIRKAYNRISTKQRQQTMVSVLSPQRAVLQLKQGYHICLTTSKSSYWPALSFCAQYDQVFSSYPLEIRESLLNPLFSLQILS